MKKLISVLLILSLLLAVPAFAEEEGTTVSAVEMNWTQEMIDAFVADGFDGNMATVTLDDGLAFQILIPDGFAQRELTEEEALEGVNMAFANEETGACFRIMDSTIESADDVSHVARALLILNPDTAITFAVVNGTTALISGMPEEDSINATFDLGNHRFVQFDFAPLEGNNKLVQYFIAAIQF